MQILVTGVLGYIGSHVIKQPLEKTNKNIIKEIIHFTGFPQVVRLVKHP